MTVRIWAGVVLLAVLSGCGINLNSLQQDTDTRRIEKLLTRECELKLPGFFQDVNISALVVHKSLRNAIPDIPENRTRIDFALTGKQENFDIEKTIFTVTTDNGNNYVISGIGGKKPIVNGVRSNSVGFTVNSMKGGSNNDLLNEFSFLLPFKLTNDIGTLKIAIHTKASENVCKLKWNFSD